MKLANLSEIKEVELADAVMHAANLLANKHAELCAPQDAHLTHSAIAYCECETATDYRALSAAGRSMRKPYILDLIREN